MFSQPHVGLKILPAFSKMSVDPLDVSQGQAM